MRRAVIGLLAVIVAGILFVVLCTYVRRPYEDVLLVRFGKLLENEKQSRIAYNWYLKLPTDSVVRIDKRLHLYTGPLQQVLTKDKQAISVRAFAAWHIVEPVKFYNTTLGSDDEAESQIDQRIRGLVNGGVSRFNMDQLFNTNEELVQTVQLEQGIARDATNGVPSTNIKEVQTGLRELGIEIVEVGFSRMAYPPSNAEAVYRSMVAGLEQQALKFDAEGRGMQQRLIAEGRAKAEEIRQQAAKEAQEIRGKAEAQARNALAAAQPTPDSRAFYQYWKSLDFIKGILAKNTVLVLASDNPLISGLFKGSLPDRTTSPGANAAAPGAATRPARSIEPASDR